MNAQTFPAPVVKELREKNNRYRLRIRDLEAALIKRAVTEAAVARGFDPSAVPTDVLMGLSVDNAGNVHGVAEAVASLQPA